MNVEYPILYIEDDDNSRFIVNFILTSVMGFHHVTTWENGIDAVTKIRVLKPVPKLIFLDIQMDPINGYEVMSRLRKEHEFDEIRVIALTASFMKEEERRLKHAGFDGGVAKPIDRDTFPGVVERIIAGEQVWHVSGSQ